MSLYESTMGNGEGQPRTPTGSPTERLVWLALFHLDGNRWRGKAAGLHPSVLQGHVGGHWRTFENALRSLLRRGIVERHKDPDVGWLYLLKEEYAQWRVDVLTAMEKRFDPEGYAEGMAYIAALKAGADLPDATEETAPKAGAVSDELL